MHWREISYDHAVLQNQGANGAVCGRAGGPCTTPFVPFLENFTVTIDPSVPISNPTAADLDIISINRPYSSLFTYMPFAEVGGEDALLFVGTYGENGCFISDSTYCLFIQVKQPLTSIGFTETTATGEVWEGANVIPEASTWLMILLGFAGLGFAGYRPTRRYAAVSLRR